LRSVWEPLSATKPSGGAAIDSHALGEDGDDDDHEYEDEDADAATDGAFWMRSRRPSTQKSLSETVPAETGSGIALSVIGPAGGLASPTAAMTAFRDQLSAQIQHLQQTMHLNLPNLPQMPTLQDYQAYLPTAPMVRRISSLVPHMGSSRPGTSDQSSKEPDYRWWDLFSGTVPAAPPAYEDIFPQGDLDVKRASAAQAAVDTIADNKCAEIFNQSQEESSTVRKRSVLLDTVRIGQRHTITREQQDQLRRAHTEKVKKLRSDRNLFFIWIPLLVIIILAMLYNRVPKAWTSAVDLLESVRNRNSGRFIEAQ
jgi:hypothetical protein